MPFNRPQLDELRRRIAADLVDKLPGADARLRHSNLRAFSEVEAGTTHLLYGRLDWSFQQLFVDTAEIEFLERWASIWGVKRVPAAAATGTATWPAEPDARIADGARARRIDNAEFTIPHGASERGGFITVTAEAMLPGADGNTEAGTELTLLTTFAGVAVAGEVAAPGLAGGADQQSDALLLRAVLARIQAPPHGGAQFDYVRWALEVPGTTRAWCYPLEMGAGTVVVRFMMDEVRAPTGIPEIADVDLVQRHIGKWNEDEGLRPVTADVHVFAPVARNVNVIIQNLLPDTPDIRDAIEISLARMIREDSEPGGTIFHEQFAGAVSMTSGVRRFQLIEPQAPVYSSGGEIITLGTVTFR